MYKDTRLGGVEKWYHTPPEDANMRIPDVLLQCVCFVCVKITEGKWADTYQSLGTGFFVSVKEGEYRFVFLVTAKHLIDEAQRGNKKEIFLRLNKKDGSGVEYVEINLDSPWHESKDPALDMVALLIPPEMGEFEMRVLPLEMIATNDIIRDYWVGPGDDLFVTGLFTHRRGRQRNFPIVRSGIISAMPMEPIYDKRTGGEFYAFLAELRSIGGLSGSPVFVTFDKTRLKQSPFSQRVLEREKDVVAAVYLLGLIRGHWELPSVDLSDTTEEPKEDVYLGFSKGENLNVGIALVTPAHFIWDMLMSDNIRQMRKDVIERFKNDDGIVQDAVAMPVEDLLFTGGDFETALKQVSQKVSPPDTETKETSE